MDKQSSTDELQEYDNLKKRIEAISNKIWSRKSIQSLLGFFGLIFFLFLVILFGGIILTVLTGAFDQYSNLFLVLGLILVVVWVVFFVVSRIIAKNIAANEVLLAKLSEEFEETKVRINKNKLLSDRDEEKLKELESQGTVSGTEPISLDLKQTDEENVKHVISSGEVKSATEKDELRFEEEQKKKGLVKFVPISLKIRELMKEEGHTKAYNSKISKKLEKHKDVPTEVTWGTPEQVFEWTQKEKGYTKIVDEKGKIKWETAKQKAKGQKERTQKSE